MPAYVPPHAHRAEGDPASKAGPDGDRGGNGSADTGESSFDPLRDEGPRPGGKDESDGSSRGERAGDRGGEQPMRMSYSSGGGDWHRRRDGRRSGGEEKAEVEVFGELKTRSSTGIDFDNYDAIPIRITGNNVEGLKPIQHFAEGKLTESLFENVRWSGYGRPTPLQKHSIPTVSQGRDLMACAQTGSGKVCAYMVPCLESLLRSGPPPCPNDSRRSKPMPCGLVLVPTREHTAGIHVEACNFCYGTGIRCCIIYGGVEMREQRLDLERGCDVLIATPGRLTDMLNRDFLTLELVQFFILDEADRMVDMGFEPQVRQIVESTGMGSSSAYPRQSMMFSATFPPEVRHMARDFLNDYVLIRVGRLGSASELVRQEVVYAEEIEGKLRALERAIKENLPEDGLALVCVETKRSADTLELELRQRGVAVTAIHGDRSLAEREESLHAFKSGAKQLLVTTDVAARGLDIPNVALVVNFDMPKQLDDYVHRIGRTGRAGRKGVAVAFVNEQCNYLPELGDLLVEAKQDPPLWWSDLCRSGDRRHAGKGGARGNKFGGQDMRLEDPGKSGPAREPDAWGSAGLEDAW